ncbi:hypothetical protein, partial [Acinetobacter pittii]|uniref:hypothetical protein n=1 Tax=Acinetobacter pittii TaxID=48296 RepID=UPI001BB3FEE9
IVTTNLFNLELVIFLFFEQFISNVKIIYRNWSINTQKRTKKKLSKKLWLYSKVLIVAISAVLSVESLRLIELCLE